MTSVCLYRSGTPGPSRFPALLSPFFWTEVNRTTYRTIFPSLVLFHSSVLLRKSLSAIDADVRVRKCVSAFQNPVKRMLPEKGIYYIKYVASALLAAFGIQCLERTDYVSFAPSGAASISRHSHGKSG